MSRTKRMLGLSGLTGMLAALAFAVPASAGSTVDGACLIQGSATTGATPVEITGGTGSYTFDSLGIACVGAEDLIKPGVIILDTTSIGTFKNTVCGTGAAKSSEGGNTLNSAEVIAPVGSKVNYANVVASLEYEVYFVALVGVLYWNDPLKGKLPLNPPQEANGILGAKPDEPGEGDEFGGVVAILPDPANNTAADPPADCTNAFQVLGAVKVVKS